MCHGSYSVEAPRLAGGKQHEEEEDEEEHTDDDARDGLVLRVLPTCLGTHVRVETRLHDRGLAERRPHAAKAQEGQPKTKAKVDGAVAGQDVPKEAAVVHAERAGNSLRHVLPVLVGGRRLSVALWPRGDVFSLCAAAAVVTRLCLCLPLMALAELTIVERVRPTDRRRG